ncbi:MAG: hypothetical protein K5756_02725 [Clostridiales bacterium]|nr:hypothetical protein [Clostridiales bacterium]
MFKKFCVISLCIILAVCTAVGGLVFAIDPFNVYRADSDLKKIIYQFPYYQNTGIARHGKYDALITGTSMTQNFRAWWFNEKFGCNAARLSFDGGVLQDFDALLNCAYKSGNEIKAVYFGLDNYIITSDSKLVDIDERVPEYLIDNNPFNDIKYLLNKDILFKYIPTYFAYRKLDTYDFYEMHAWDRDNYIFSEESVLKGYTRPDPAPPLPEDEFIDESGLVLETLLKYVREHPETSFTFFAPPYSKLYWNSLRISGKLSATVAALKHVYGELLKNKNVRVFYFQNDIERIENLDNYKDETHYCTDYNKYMLDCFVSGERELTLSNYESELDKMEAYANTLNI